MFTSAWSVCTLVFVGSLASCSQNGDYLQYASTQMRRDPDVVLAAVKNKGFAMKYAGPELVEDAAFIMKVVQECSIGYKYAGVNGYQFTPLGRDHSLTTTDCPQFHAKQAD